MKELVLFSKSLHIRFDKPLRYKGSLGDEFLVCHEEALELYKELLKRLSEIELRRDITVRLDYFHVERGYSLCVKLFKVGFEVNFLFNLYIYHNKAVLETSQYLRDLLSGSDKVLTI
jgi:hypothetical protein